MPTKLSKYCGRIMEAAWLASVVIIPIFFNVYSSRIFEPDKIALLRSITLVILGAWIVKVVDEGGIKWNNIQSNGSPIRNLLEIPFVVPVLAIASVYILATIFSVTPRVSILGSYQRLQGAYTTLSYIIIFAAMAVNLRSRAQVDRLLTAIIISSLPVTLYGILQRYKLDPIPWGGDTTIRIASSMGNSIFIAAYLIMVFPLTLGRIIEAFRAILTESQNIASHIIRASIYIFIATLQVLALYMSGSRGPTLGWIAGTFFIVLMLTVFWRKRWATIAIVVASIGLALFLLVFNIENGPLEKLRSSPAIGRFGLLLNAESNSALVRRYIWEGAVELVTPHSALEYPNGKKDIFNFFRPVVGYGPESMFVAYNRYYVPELGLVERRNATPDRSHNETWDTLVITGLLGLAAYLLVFSSVFYYGLKWIGLIPNRSKKIIFWSLYFGGGLVGALGFSLWRGFEYIGVGLPFGILIGLFVYIILAAITYSFDPPKNNHQVVKFITLIVILAAIISHFVEINFGIAIVVTRMYFWIFTALLLLVGYVLPRTGIYGHNLIPALESDVKTHVDSNKKGAMANPSILAKQPGYSGTQRQKRKMDKRSSRSRAVPRADRNRAWLWEAIVAGILLAILLVTIGFDLIAYNANSKSTFGILSFSLTSLRNISTNSYGILGLVLITWIFSATLMATEVLVLQKREYTSEEISKTGTLLKIFAIVLCTSFFLGFLYWLLHSGSIASITRITPQSIEELRNQVSRFAGLLTLYYAYVVILIFFAAWMLAVRNDYRLINMTARGAVVGFVTFITVIFLVIYSNLRVIQADITFKLAEQFAKSDTWPVAIEIYKQANKLAPNEDYYYLFLGRAYFEQAKSITDAAQREGLFVKAEQDLKKAQNINPLNTDHTANLARLYSLWAAYTDDPVKQQERIEVSDDYFSKALSLSPKNVRLWDEWAFLTLEELKDSEKAHQLLLTALELDPTYSWTYGLLGDYYTKIANGTQDQDQRQGLLDRAVEFYNQALNKPGDPQANFRVALSLGDLDIQNNRPLEAISAYQQALLLIPNTPERWKIEETIARLYLQVGDLQNALVNAQNAFSSAPDDQKARIQSLIDQMKAQP
jgi:tetratricopeptide (TPR) repeat protein